MKYAAIVAIALRRKVGPLSSASDCEAGRPSGRGSEPLG